MLQSISIGLVDSNDTKHILIIKIFLKNIRIDLIDYNKLNVLIFNFEKRELVLVKWYIYTY